MSVQGRGARDHRHGGKGGGKGDGKAGRQTSTTSYNEKKRDQSEGLSLGEAYHMLQQGRRPAGPEPTRIEPADPEHNPGTAQSGSMSSSGTARRRGRAPAKVHAQDVAMSDNNQEMVVGLLRTLRAEGQAEDAGEEDPSAWSPHQSTLGSECDIEPDSVGIEEGLGLGVDARQRAEVVGVFADSARVGEFIAAQEVRAEEVQRAAAQRAHARAQAEAAAQRTRSLREQLHASLLAMGFSEEWAAKGMRHVACCGALEDSESGILEGEAAALDWLCLHVPLEECPAAFTRLRAGGGLASAPGMPGFEPRSEGAEAESDRYVAMVRRVLMRRLEALGFVKEEVRCALEHHLYDDERAMHT
ncbi:hypothetical protein CYMTET_13992, partial [Cymbomonas tetramitiformis]